MVAKIVIRKAREGPNLRARGAVRRIRGKGDF